MKVSPFPFDPDRGIDSVPWVDTDDPELIKRLQFLESETGVKSTFEQHTNLVPNASDSNIATGFSQLQSGWYRFEKHGLHSNIEPLRIMFNSRGADSAGGVGTVGLGVDVALAEIRAALGLPTPSPLVQYEDSLVATDCPVGAKVAGYGGKTYLMVTGKGYEAQYPIGSIYEWKHDGITTFVRRSAITDFSKPPTSPFSGYGKIPTWEEISRDQVPL